MTESAVSRADYVHGYSGRESQRLLDSSRHLG
jgi:hypothetical protein